MTNSQLTSLLLYRGARPAGRLKTVTGTGPFFCEIIQCRYTVQIVILMSEIELSSSFTQNEVSSIVKSLKKNGAKILTSVSIASSKLGGTGLFYTPTSNSSPELLRIPRTCLISLVGFFKQTLPKLELYYKSYWNSEFEEYFVSELTFIRGFQQLLLAALEANPSSDTIELQYVFLAIVTVKKYLDYVLPNLKSTKVKEFILNLPLRMYDEYVAAVLKISIPTFDNQIVFDTPEILSANEDADDHDLLYKIYKNYTDKAPFNESLENILTDRYQIYEEIVDMLASATEASEKFITESVLSLETFHQTLSVVKTRSLSIPRSVQSTEDGIDASNSQDFVIDATLVPLLDFANHSSEHSNAHFDVDRKTGDILLIFTGDKDKKSEIYISYEICQSVDAFVMNYGFIPSGILEIQFSLKSVLEKHPEFSDRDDSVLLAEINYIEGKLRCLSLIRDGEFAELFESEKGFQADNEPLVTHLSEDVLLAGLSIDGKLSHNRPYTLLREFINLRSTELQELATILAPYHLDDESLINQLIELEKAALEEIELQVNNQLFR